MSTPGSPDRRRIAALLAGALIGVAATAAPDDATQRARIDRDRAAAQARYREALQACAGRFALTACQDRARAERRETFDRLDAEEADLDAAQRRRRALERRREIERNAAPRPAEGVAASQPQPQARPTPTPILPKAAPAQADAASAATARREAQEIERYRQRQERAAAHKAEVERRNAEQQARKPPAQGLPPPPASR